MNGWGDFTDSQHWDALCEFASIKVIQSKAFVEDDDGTLTLVMRTANPKLNPRAVAAGESSTNFRRDIAQVTQKALAHHNNPS